MGRRRTLRVRLILIATALVLGSLSVTAQAGAYVYWSYSAPSRDTSGIGRADQDGAGGIETAIPVSGTDLLNSTLFGGLHYPNATEHAGGGVAIGGREVFWGWTAPSAYASGVGEARLGGADGHGTFVAVRPADHPGGVAADGTHLYWAWYAPSDDASGIGRSAIGGSHIQSTFIPISGSDHPAGVAVDAGHVYWAWSSPSGDTSGIGRADLNGSHVQSTFISLDGRDQTTGMTVDGHDLYWSWSGPSLDESGIGRARLDGTHVQGTFIPIDGRDQTSGVAVDTGYVYWSWTAPSDDASGIGRAHLSGSHADGSFIPISGAEQLGGLAVGGPPAEVSADHLRARQRGRQADRAPRPVAQSAHPVLLPLATVSRQSESLQDDRQSGQREVHAVQRRCRPPDSAAGRRHQRLGQRRSAVLPSDLRGDGGRCAGQPVVAVDLRLSGSGNDAHRLARPLVPIRRGTPISGRIATRSAPTTAVSSPVPKVRPTPSPPPMSEM